MARNYGRVATSIWRDPDFLLLGSDARFAYVMLFSQPKISAVGVIEVTGRRWANSLGFTGERLTAALGELVARCYIVIDEDTEELFVRSFVRSDGGANNDLRRKAIDSSSDAVVSLPIRASIAVELDRLGLPHHLSKPLQGPIEARRVVVKEGESVLEPFTLTTSREPVVAAAPDGLSPFCPDHRPNGTSDPCGPCGTWGVAFRLQQKREADAIIAAKAARASAARTAADCEWCKGGTWRIDDPTLKCDHHALSVSGSPAVGAK